MSTSGEIMVLIIFPRFDLFQDNNFFDGSEEPDLMAENQNELMKGQINQSVQQFPVQVCK